MRKKYIITEEEFEAIKEAIIDTLNLRRYEFIQGVSYDGARRSMSKKTFFESLKQQFIVE